ncbi:MAG: Mth938-like domain-containing protein [Proteobacteria bacterium]|nr:Mth938-like domain-containing protein [Pseudomonadota bacterium]
MDITPLVPAGRQLIQSYGGGRFRIAGQVHQGSVLVFPERTLPWPVTGIDGITLDSLADVTASGQAADILIIGCGPAFLPVPKGLREGLKAAAVALEWMDTGAACRTFNVLLAEDRACAAALIAVE